MATANRARTAASASMPIRSLTVSGLDKPHSGQGPDDRLDDGAGIEARPASGQHGLARQRERGDDGENPEDRRFLVFHGGLLVRLSASTPGSASPPAARPSGRPPPRSPGWPRLSLLAPGDVQGDPCRRLVAQRVAGSRSSVLPRRPEGQEQDHGNEEEKSPESRELPYEPVRRARGQFRLAQHPPPMTQRVHQVLQLPTICSQPHSTQPISKPRSSRQRL